MQLRKIVVLVIGMVLLIAVALGNSQPVLFEKVETRCGWFSNPTPANASLYDAQREWIISVQGGYEAEGDWPDIPEKQWVITNVHYGYGCTCMRVEFLSKVVYGSIRRRPYECSLVFRL